MQNQDREQQLVATRPKLNYTSRIKLENRIPPA